VPATNGKPKAGRMTHVRVRVEDQMVLRELAYQRRTSIAAVIADLMPRRPRVRPEPRAVAAAV
jgi:hypothetical protein